ncbi:(S)-8-oxocitronellyl enol synthase CYC2-like [Telopea speciosissima]|uniref:(S)-8-oxocitronellyl enol synthase CYC2-like n=1 Tax=Telopea speciosissima TaxID=54955 RepID=UPI001CC7F5BC|nr:(S)-8-oxocitronellyl enol synthase CYC2-like [Telopea speciosissima]
MFDVNEGNSRSVAEILRRGCEVGEEWRCRRVDLENSSTPALVVPTPCEDSFYKSHKSSFISHCNYYYILLNIKQIGEELARTLAARVGWKVYGIARKADELQIPSSNYQFISCDLLDPIQTTEKVSLLEDVTHVYWITWASQYPLDSPECCEQNKAMMSNALNAILPKAKALKHVSLQTGGKHYLSLTSPSNSKPILYYEDSPRVDQGHIFYYILEDLLMEKLEGMMAWSVHRPGLLIGISNRTYYNFIGGLCVYASICKYLNLPFLFGGSKECWEEVYIDGADARLVAEQHIWASTNKNISSTKGQAFNVTNGPSFTCFISLQPVRQVGWTLDHVFGIARAKKRGRWVLLA